MPSKNCSAQVTQEPCAGTEDDGFTRVKGFSLLIAPIILGYIIRQ